MAKVKFDTKNILTDLGACSVKRDEYAGLSLKKAWNGIDSLNDFIWLITRLMSFGSSREYYERASYAALAAIIEESSLKDSDKSHIKGANVYIDNLNNAAAGLKYDKSSVQNFTLSGNYPWCSEFACWNCAHSYCIDMCASSEALDNIRRVVRVPTEKEILNCCDDYKNSSYIEAGY